ncbi:MAG: zinc ribbon domain-containing protein [Clostridia bacterium]|nr:zinc ribbon domain-containing protein [Clostridia bacterium]
MKFAESVGRVLRKAMFEPKWKCLVCEKEIFDGGYFCSDCEEKLPRITDAYCDHCGRKLNVSALFCTTCKGNLTQVDKARSLYEYGGEMSSLIKRRSIQARNIFTTRSPKTLKISTLRLVLTRT